MRGLFSNKNSGNRERPSAASLSPHQTSSNLLQTVPNPSVRPGQGSRLIAASAGHPPPPGRHHSVSSISQGSTVQLIGPTNAAEGLGIGYGITTEDTAAYRPQSAEPTGIPPPSSLNTQQGQSSSRRPLAANSNNSYRGPSQQPPPQQSPQPQQLQGQNSNNNTSNNGAPPQGTSQIASLTGSISRRISLRSPRGSPHQPQGQFPHNSSETSELPDPYNQSTGPPRPQSMHPATPVLVEEESHQYTLQRAATDVDSQYLQSLPSLQQVDSLGHPIQQPPQGFQQQQQQQQQYYQGQQQQQQMPPPRRSMEIQNNPLQHPQVTQLQQTMQAPYGNQQPGSPLPPPTPGQQAYQQAYDPSKFTEPLGRMTPPLNSGQQQHPQQQQSQQGGQQPQSSTARTGNLDIAKLCDDYDNLQAKYRKVKNLYFERNSEIERLQNTLAHQRLAQSRTSLDDSEYVSRFERLDGAIKNVAFEIRQSWKTIPPWLQPVTNHGAEAKGGREMTVVGRASISRWVIDEILERFFHPGLDAALSMNLKSIEQGIRRNHPDPHSIEEDDALSSKVCNWRLTTLDALRQDLQSPSAVEFKARLTQHLVEKLVVSLQTHLHEPTPPGLLGGVSMIVEIAVGLASNLPLESRDVRVWYPLPGVPFDGKFMKAEGQLPPLVQPISGGEGTASEGGDKMEVDQQNPEENGVGKDAPLKPSGSVHGPGVPGGQGGQGGQASQGVNRETSNSSNKSAEQPKSKSLGVAGRIRQRVQEAAGRGHSDGRDPRPPIGQPTPTGQQPGGPPPLLQKGNSQVNLPADGAPGGQPPKEEQKMVRIAGFMAVEVRGRSILVKAPVWC